MSNAFNSQIRNCNITGTQKIRKPLGGSARRVLRNVAVLPEPVIDSNGFGHVAIAIVKLPHLGEVPVRLRCVVSDGKLHTYGWEVC